MTREEFKTRLAGKIRGNDLILEEIADTELDPTTGQEKLRGTMRISVDLDTFWAMFGPEFESPGPPGDVLIRLRAKDRSPGPDAKPADRGYSKYFHAWRAEGLI